MEGSEQGAGVVTEAAPVESGVQEQVEQPVAGTEQVEAPAEQTQAVDWATQALPQGHPSGTKYKTIGDLTRAYEASGNEGRRLYRENQEIRRQLQALSRTDKAPAQEAAPAAYFGFGSREKWAAAMNADPEGTMRQIIASNAKDLIAKEVADIRGQLGKFSQSAAEQSRNAQFAELTTRYPELKDTRSPGNQAAVQFLDRNPWVAELTSNQDVNAFEVTYKLANYDLLAAKLADAESKLKAVGARSQAARPGSGAPKQIKQDSSSASAVDAAAEEVRAAGGEVDQKWIEQAKKSGKRILGF